MESSFKWNANIAFRVIIFKLRYYKDFIKILHKKGGIEHGTKANCKNAKERCKKEVRAPVVEEALPDPAPKEQSPSPPEANQFSLPKCDPEEAINTSSIDLAEPKKPIMKKSAKKEVNTKMAKDKKKDKKKGKKKGKK